MKELINNKTAEWGARINIRMDGYWVINDWILKKELVLFVSV